MKTIQHKHTNLLVHESSPYLLQHAHNPVDWHAWNKETLAKAKDENKMILVSIGYSACHWCHVMEHESFEDEEVAKLMNKNFICIKVDREERPDVDQVYMDAVQMLSGHGGWPLNCFALPDGRPFWGGTYFPKNQWTDVLSQITHLYQSQKAVLENQAEEISAGIQKNDLLNIFSGREPDFSKSVVDEMVRKLSRRFDADNGGTVGAPKFPMPNIYLFLLRYWHHTKNEEIINHIEKTLTAMARGGIYDQIGGGFARYSVDDHWHVPHFEKMLYDNAQLISLYAEAYRATQNHLYKKVIEESIDFIERELTSPEGGFYAALDADSEGEEGRFYVWTKSEIEKVTGKDAPLISAFFGIENESYWEEGKNVLVQAPTKDELSKTFHLPKREVEARINIAKQKLIAYRSKRTRPGLDDKILTSWNALMMKGYIDAYKALGNDSYLAAAIRNAEFIFNNLLQEDFQLLRNFKNGKATIPGFLDDYSFVIEAWLALFEVTLKEKWAFRAKSLAEYVIAHFYDPEMGMFFYTSDEHSDVVARKKEILDNVIPASNSSMARNLHLLSLIFEKPSYASMVRKMLAQVQENMLKYPSAFTNWGIQYLSEVYPFYTFAVTGKKSKEFIQECFRRFTPEIYLAGASEKSGLPLLQNRIDKSVTRIFVCTGSECLMPVKTVDEAFKLISQ